MFPDEALTGGLVPRSRPGRIVFCTVLRIGASKASASFLIVPREDNPYCRTTLAAALNSADALAEAIGGEGLRDVKRLMHRDCTRLRTLRLADVAELDAYIAGMPF